MNPILHGVVLVVGAMGILTITAAVTVTVMYYVNEWLDS